MALDAVRVAPVQLVPPSGEFLASYARRIEAGDGDQGDPGVGSSGYESEAWRQAITAESMRFRSIGTPRPAAMATLNARAVSVAARSASASALCGSAASHDSTVELLAQAWASVRTR